MPFSVSLRGDRRWDPGVPAHIRERGARHIGGLGHSLLRSRVADPHHRLALCEGRRELAARPSATAHERRLGSWDVWSQAAMAAEDLEMLLAAGEKWQQDHERDFFDDYNAVEALGPDFFRLKTLGWQLKLARTLQFPVKQTLRTMLSAPQTDLLAEGLRNSLLAACEDLDALAEHVPLLARFAMIRYKHGFVWLPLAHAPLETDRFGIERMQAAPNGFVVWTRHGSGVVHEGTLGEIDDGVAVARTIAALDGFIARALLTQAEHRSGAWGIALYGSSAADPAVSGLAHLVEAAISQP